MAGKFWREAASLILVKKKNFVDRIAPNFDILFSERSSKSPFMPSALVFPGGTTAEEDFSKTWINYITKDGITQESLKADFQFHIKKPEFYSNKDNFPEIGFRICALRETFEETGVLLVHDETEPTKPKVIVDDNLISQWIPKVQEDPSLFLSLHKELGATPAIWALHEWCAWLTPTTYKSKNARFDTPFYITFTDEDFEITDHSVIKEESDMVDILCPRKIMENLIRRKNLFLAPPQAYEICRFLQFKDYDEFKSFSEARAKCGIARWLSVLIETDNGVIGALPGDDLYPSDPDYFGERPSIRIDESVTESRNSCTNLNRIEIMPRLSNGPVVNINLEFNQKSPINFYELTKSILHKL